MTDIREKYEEYSIEEIIQVCIERGVIVPPDTLDDRDALLSLLHHDINQAIQILVEVDHFHLFLILPQH